MTEFEQRLSLTSTTVDDRHITLYLVDGRIIKVPLAWFPRVAVASPEDRQDFEILGGRGVVWFRLGEDLTVEQILKGQGSYESEASFRAWQTLYDQGEVSRAFEFLPTSAFE